MAIIHLALVHNLLAVIMSMRRQEESGEKVRNQENSWECGSGIRRKSEESDEHVARRLPHIAVLADMQPFPQRRQSTVTLPEANQEVVLRDLRVKNQQTLLSASQSQLASVEVRDYVTTSMG